MKKLLSSLLAFGLVALGPSAFAIDAIIHDIGGHTIGFGRHHHYYGYNYGYGGYSAYPGYYGYGQPYYSHTRVIWSGGHQRHRATALGRFGLGHRRGR